jgi:heptosyltransferase-3
VYVADFLKFLSLSPILAQRGSRLAEERILLVQLRQLGDILLTTPCLRAIKRERPKAKLTFLSHTMGRLVLDHCPFLDEHFFFDEKTSISEQLRLMRTLRERHFDVVIDFMNNPRSALYTWITAGLERIAFSSARRPAYTRLVPRPEPGRYIVQEKFDLLAAAGLARPTDERLVLPWFEVHTQPFMRLWAESQLFKDAPYRIALSPTHRRVARRWPLASYAALADRLATEWGAAVVWLWGPGEEGEIDAAMALTKTKTIKAPKTSFREMAALVGNMHLFVGNSNGPSHVAVADGICSLQLHGHTDARAWCPMTPEHQALQSPEFGAGTRHLARMDLISVDAVWDKLTAMRPTIDAFRATARAQRPRLVWHG